MLTYHYGSQDDPDHAVDLIPAVDPQPGVPLAELDPALWLGDGRRRNRTDRADVEHDNTLHAGLALVAVQEFCRVSKTGLIAESVEAAVRAYREAGHLQDEEDLAVVTELMAGVHHLRDARGIAPDEPSLYEGPATGLTLALFILVAQLELVAVTTWAERLGEPWQAIEHTALHWYRDQVAAQPEPTRKAVAVWITRHGEFLGCEWFLDELAPRAADGACTYCLHLGQAGPCPGLESHVATQIGRMNQCCTPGEVEGGVFDIPDHVRTPEHVLAEIERQIKQG